MSIGGSDTIEPIEPDPVNTGVGSRTIVSLSTRKPGLHHYLEALMRKLLTTLSAITIAIPLFGQDLDGIEDEIIVTADFRDNYLIKSAGSTTVIENNKSSDLAARHLEDILSLAPNVTQSAGASRSRFLQIRGIGDLEQYAEPKYYPAVGLILDGVEIGSSANAAMLFDLNQVEILRGPQGTRFGSSGYAGVVYLQSNAPTDEFEGSITAGGGNYDARNFGVVFSGGVSETLRGRVAVQKNEGDGFHKNAFLKSDNNAGFDELTTRVRLDWNPVTNSQYQLSILNFESKNGYDVWSLDNSRTTQTDTPGEDIQDTLAISLKGNWALRNSLSLEASITQNESDLNYNYDADWINPGFCVTYTCSYGHDNAVESFSRDLDQMTTEVRLLGGEEILSRGDTRYVVGIYRKSTKENLDYGYPSDWYGNYSVRTNYETSRNAFYGEIEYGITDAFSISAGTRIENFEDDYSDTNTVRHNNDNTLTNLEITGLMNLSDESLLYATLSLADKPGGVNVSASSQFGSMSAPFRIFMSPKLNFQSESLINKEIGYKRLDINSQFSIRAALFHTTRSNAQLESWMWDDSAGLWIGYLDSTSDASNYGVEFESTVNPHERIQLFANVSLLRTEVDNLATFDLDVFDFVNRSGRDQTKSPEYQYALGINALLRPDVSASLSIEGRDDTYFGYYHNGMLDRYDIVNANLRWRGSNLSINVWGRNLTDKNYSTHGLYFGADPRDDFGFWANQSYRQFGAPRTFGLDFEFLF